MKILIILTVLFNGRITVVSPQLRLEQSSPVWVEDNSKLFGIVDKVCQNDLSISSLMSVIFELPPTVS